MEPHEKCDQQDAKDRELIRSGFDRVGMSNASFDGASFSIICMAETSVTISDTGISDGRIARTNRNDQTIQG